VSRSDADTQNHAEHNMPCALIYPWKWNDRAAGRTPRNPPAGEGGSHMLRGPMLRMKKNFLVFLMFSKYLWRYSCIMKSTDSVVTYLIFEFLIPACYSLLTRICVHSAHCVWKCTVIFSWILNMGPHSCIAVARQIQLWGPPRGGSWGPGEGASLRGPPTL